MLPDIDKKELDREKERNLLERLGFIERYAQWLKKTPNKVWSRQQKNVID